MVALRSSGCARDFTGTGAGAQAMTHPPVMFAGQMTEQQQATFNGLLPWHTAG